MNSRSSGQRAFNPMGIPGLSEEAKRAAAGAFEALSAWRNELSDSNERHGEKVFQRMGEAAKALGWPPEIVDATQQHMLSISKMQTQMMDQMMEAWEEQLRSPNPMGAFPAAMFSKLQSFPGFPGGAGFPGFPGMPGMAGMGAGAMNPMQFWMQVGEQWQKNWAQAMQFWASQGPGGDGRKS